MTDDCDKKVFILYGPPGAGKGTQAERIAQTKGYVHFDSGKFIEKLINDPANLRSKIVKKQRELFLSGKLCDPKWIGAEVKKKIKEYSKKGRGLVFSGSPRTIEEAFKLKGGGMIELLEKEYGQSNITVFFLDIPVVESVKRNSKRGRAGLDIPKVIRIRCREYKRLTLPIIKELKKRGIRVINIDGRPLPGKVSRDIASEIKKIFRCQRLKPTKTFQSLKRPGRY